MIFSVSMTKTFIFVPCGASVLTNISNFKITSNRYRNRTECNKCTKTDLFTVVITCPDTGVFLKFFCTILMEFVVALFSRLLIESIIKGRFEKIVLYNATQLPCNIWLFKKFMLKYLSDACSKNNIP